jgi:hypothetical protein
VPENHALLTYIFFGTFNISVYGTIAETIMIFYLFGGSWSRWELSFKIVTPILHVLFTIAQLHAARILLSMWRREKRKLATSDGEDLETGSKKKGSTNDEEVVIATRPVSNGGQDSIEAEQSSTGSQRTLRDDDSERGKGVFGRAMGSARRFVTGR